MTERRFDAPLIRFFFEALERRGYKTAPLAEDFEVEREGERWSVPLASAGELFERCAELANDPIFGVHVAEGLPRGSYGLIEFLWRNGPNIGAVYESMKRHQRRAASPMDPQWRDLGPGYGRLSFGVLPAPFSLGRQVHEFLLAQTVSMARQVTAGAFKVRSVGFAHPAGQSGAALKQWFGATVLFDQTENWLELDTQELARPTVGADAALYQVLDAHLLKLREKAAAPTGLREQLQQALEERVARGTPTELKSLAADLKMPERTLQRRLDDEGTHLRELIDQARHKRALKLLADPALSIEAVAEQLGFSSHSAFTRAFRRWTGQSPNSFRADVHGP